MTIFQYMFKVSRNLKWTSNYKRSIIAYTNLNLNLACDTQYISWNGSFDQKCNFTHHICIKSSERNPGLRAAVILEFGPSIDLQTNRLLIPDSTGGFWRRKVAKLVLLLIVRTLYFVGLHQHLLLAVLFLFQDGITLWYGLKPMKIWLHNTIERIYHN